MKVLLVEDDKLLGNSVYNALKSEHEEVDWVEDGEAAINAIGDPAYDVVILGLGLPKVNGLDVLRFARSNDYNVPILIVTAQCSTEDRVAALDMGADDYLTKPFEFEELSARLRALYRRSRGNSDDVLKYRDIEVNLTSHIASKDGEPIDLSRREFVLLTELVNNVGRIMSKKQLEEKVYGWSDTIDSNTIEVFIHHLRKKFGTEIITTVRGVGYMVPGGVDKTAVRS